MAEIHLTIKNGNTIYEPGISGDIKWETARKDSPGKLTFDVVKDTKINFQEGNHVTLQIDGKGVFYGFVFIKRRDKEGVISVTAYDQIRYLKNKDVLQYSNMTADELIKMIADKYSFPCGSLAPTGYKIADRLEDNKSYLDMIQWALDATVQNTNQLYVLYDDFGKLTLKHFEDMRVDWVVADNTAGNFDYETSIDGETYNVIKLFEENKQQGTRIPYIAEDSKHVKEWGLLQYCEKLNEKENGKEKAESLLSLYNHKGRSLSVKDVIGNLDVRGGSSLPVQLALGDIDVNHYFIVDKVTHTINSDEHRMDVTLMGGEFNA